MPPGAAEFTVGCKLQSDVFLLPDDLLDLAVARRPSVRPRRFAFRTALGACFFERCGSQQAADVIGAKRWVVRWVMRCLLFPPHFVRQLYDHPQFGPLFILSEHIALFGRCEAALRRQAELIKRHIFGCLFDPPF